MNVKVLLLAALVVVAMASRGTPVVTVCSSPNAILKNLQYTISPSNIVPGVNLTVGISGTLTQSVTSGEVVLTASFDGIPIVSKKINLCKDLACPVAAGPFHYNVVHSIPNLPVSGTVDAQATITAQDNLQVACVDVACSI